MFKKISLTYAPLLIFLLIDILTKSAAVHSGQYVRNTGVIMGVFSQLPSPGKEVLICGLGVSVLAAYLFITSCFVIKTRSFAFGLSLFVAGVLGNILDRALYGYVVDFIPIPNVATFNLADLFQLTGLAIAVLSWKSELDHHLPHDNQRVTSFIPAFVPRRFFLGFFALYFCVALILFCFSWLFLKYTLVQSGLVQDQEISRVLTSFSLLFLLFMGIIAALILAAARIISARIYGPIHAIENYLDDTLDGRKRPFSLREGDYFRELESKLTEINERLVK